MSSWIGHAFSCVRFVGMQLLYYTHVSHVQMKLALHPSSISLAYDIDMTKLCI